MSKAKSDKVSSDLDTPTDLPQEAVDKISAALNTLLADAFALVEHQMIVVEMPASRSLRPGARSRAPLARNGNANSSASTISPAVRFLPAPDRCSAA